MFSKNRGEGGCLFAQEPNALSLLERMLGRKYPAYLRNTCNFRLKIELKKLVPFGRKKNKRHWIELVLKASLIYKIFGHVFLIGLTYPAKQRCNNNRNVLQEKTNTWNPVVSAGTRLFGLGYIQLSSFSV